MLAFVFNPGIGVGRGNNTQFFAHLKTDYSLDIRLPYLSSEKCSQILIA